jgi:outer membrane protein assembly factor BamB
MLPYLRTATLLSFAVCVTSTVLADDWPSWRGPDGSGHSKESGLPIKWSADAAMWRTALPGEGQSSPAIWGDRIFLTTALDKGKRRVVLCVDRKKGTILWQKEAWTGTPEKTHGMNGWASATCATDGERVIAFFGKGGLHCYDIDGKKLWSRDLGQFPGPWGTAACPLLVGDLVVQNCDSTANAYIIAVNKNTGKNVWKTPRADCPKGGWSSPVLVDAGQRKEIVLNGEDAVITYEPATGKELWRCKSFAGRGEPTVAPGNGQVFVVNGLAGDIYSVKLGGAGDVTRSHMAWHTPRKVRRDEPSPIVVGNHLLVADMDGIVTCYDSATGKTHWKERLRESGYTASPIAAGGLVYFLSEAGVASVIEPATTFKLVAENSLGTKGEIFRASLAASNGQIFVRSQTHLYCIGKAAGK